MKKALVLALLLLATPALAQVQQSVVSNSVSGGGGGYSGPGDVVASASLWWGLRAYSAAKRGTKAVQLCNVGDVACVDVNSDATTGIVSSTQVVGSVTCGTGANQCTAKTVYDQSGAAKDMAQATESQRPRFVVNCIGTLPCLSFASASSQSLQTANTLTGINQPYTMSLIVERTSNFTTSMRGQDISSTVYFPASANAINIYAGAVLSATATDSAFHAVQGVFNSTSSADVIDGSATTGDASTNATGTQGAWGEVAASNFLDGRICEGGVWPIAFNATQYGNMNTNQHNFWGF